MNYLENEKKMFKRNGSIKLFLTMAGIIAILVTVIILMLPKEEAKPTAVIAGCLTDVEEHTYHRYNYNFVDEYKDPREVFGIKLPFTTKSFVYSIPGSISYGYDMTEIKEKDIKVNEATKTISINMPELYILSHEQFTEKEAVYAERNNILNTIKTEDLEKVQIDVKNKTELQAIKLGVVEETEENAQKCIGDLLTALPEYKEYTVKCSFGNQDEVRHIEDVRANSDEV